MIKKVTVYHTVIMVHCTDTVCVIQSTGIVQSQARPMVLNICVVVKTHVWLKKHRSPFNNTA